jgi:ATP/ADP translocase
MTWLKSAGRSLFDIRPGEIRRTAFMSLYLLFVMFAYYILRSASESLFLNKFDIDKLPNLYILMAVFGGALGYIYSKAAAHTSLHTAVTWTLFLSILCLVIMWFPLRGRDSTMVYVFAVWVRLFSVVTVTQGWVVATNLFTPREAKRLYGLLGMGMVAGAIFGGELTTQLVRFIGTDDLLFASAPLVLLAYLAYLIAIRGYSVVKQAEGEEKNDFSIRDVASDIGKSRHLQVLMLIMMAQFMVDTFIDYQFKYMAKATYHGDALTAFLGRFYGRYLNITELVLQFFFTALVVKRLGVGGTMQIMPISLGIASVVTYATPSSLTTSIARLTEASTRYTLARTGNELFYMPLPLEVRNRIKGFVDIFMDRAARGISGLLLLLFAQWKMGVRGIALVTFGLAVPWIFLTICAQREYVRTIRRRLEARRLNIEGARILVQDAETVRLLETTASEGNPRQAAYAISLLGDAPGYDATPLLKRLADAPFAEVRTQLYTLARRCGSTSLVERAMADIESADPSPTAQEAIFYALSVSSGCESRILEFLDHANPAVAAGVVEALASNSQLGGAELQEWMTRAASHPDSNRRALAARVAGVLGGRAAETLTILLADPAPAVAAAACQAAGRLKTRDHVFAVARLLASYRTRGAAIEALAQYGPAICGTLGDMLEDAVVPLAVRVQIPRVLKRIPHQRSVEILVAAYRSGEPEIRAAALKGLSRLRESGSSLTFANSYLVPHAINEAHRFYELAAAAAPLEVHRRERGSAASLLVRTLEERQRDTVQRLFRLLGLIKSPKEMYWSYLALSGHDKERRANAIEYLDNVLDRDLKNVVIPIFDNPTRMLERGRVLFGVEPACASSVIRAMLHSADSWVAACAMAAAAELKLSELADEIAQLEQRSAGDIGVVARAAKAALK